MSTSLYDTASEAACYIAERAGVRKPRVAIVLGSGLGGVADSIPDGVEIPYDEIPHFPTSTVDGHAGSLLIGSIEGVDVVVMKGRFHFYEGYSMEQVTLPVRVFKLMGIGSLFLTNAAGSTSTKLAPGSLMIITDHLNMFGENPLRGPNDERFGPRFPDMTSVYAADFMDIAHEAAREIGIVLAEGVYVGLRGPSYETPAEIRMLRDLGADAVGMSTVPEAIVARYCGIKVLAVSCISNLCAGLTRNQINHSEVMEVGARAQEQLSKLILRVVPRLAPTA
ncbi:MAG TPA: purine-nucleoside phosphorylase [Blastocatellia bacterium]|nr:purine-nucleoside phosphorylase [Blastocatellia bacterium]